jgi:hypothetical protein
MSSPSTHADSPAPTVVERDNHPPVGASDSVGPTQLPGVPVVSMGGPMGGMISPGYPFPFPNQYVPQSVSIGVLDQFRRQMEDEQRELKNVVHQLKLKAEQAEVDSRRAQEELKYLKKALKKTTEERDLLYYKNSYPNQQHQQQQQPRMRGINSHPLVINNSEVLRVADSDLPLSVRESLPSDTAFLYPDGSTTTQQQQQQHQPHQLSQKISNTKQQQKVIQSEENLVRSSLGSRGADLLLERNESRLHRLKNLSELSEKEELAKDSCTFS